MFVHVDPSNGIAIYDQIVRQVKFAVASEALKPGIWFRRSASWLAI